MSTSSADYMVPIVVFCVSLCTVCVSVRTVCVLGYKDVLSLLWDGSQLQYRYLLH